MFFRQCKDKLTLDSYKIRSTQEIRRYWLLMSFTHYMCVVGTGEVCAFETGYHRIGDKSKRKNIGFSTNTQRNTMILILL